MTFWISSASRRALTTAGFASSAIPDRGMLLSSLHHAFLVLGGITILSAAVFVGLRRGDGDNVSGHQEPQTVPADTGAV